ncbi:MAG: hypothetical protein PVH04_08225, partial [Gammaproteobacteria bacterium]
AINRVMRCISASLRYPVVVRICAEKPTPIQIHNCWEVWCENTSAIRVLPLIITTRLKYWIFPRHFENDRRYDTKHKIDKYTELYQRVYFPEQPVPLGYTREPKNWCESTAPEGKTAVVTEHFCIRGDASEISRAK